MCCKITTYSQNILAVREKITPLLRDALGYDKFEELMKGSEADAD